MSPPLTVDTTIITQSPFQHSCLTLLSKLSLLLFLKMGRPLVKPQLLLSLSLRLDYHRARPTSLLQLSVMAFSGRAVRLWPKPDSSRASSVSRQWKSSCHKLWPRLTCPLQVHPVHSLSSCGLYEVESDRDLCQFSRYTDQEPKEMVVVVAATVSGTYFHIRKSEA